MSHVSRTLATTWSSKSADQAWNATVKACCLRRSSRRRSRTDHASEHAWVRAEGTWIQLPQAHFLLDIIRSPPNAAQYLLLRMGQLKTSISQKCLQPANACIAAYLSARVILCKATATAAASSATESWRGSSGGWCHTVYHPGSPGQRVSCYILLRS